MHPFAVFSINNFFKHQSPISRAECDQVASTIGGGANVTPTGTQGSQSYTLRVGEGASSFIVQFRDPDFALNLEVIAAAREAYGKFVPKCEKRDETLGSLHIYKMENVSGQALLHVSTQFHKPGNFHLLQQTVKDFASFCASAWNKSMPSFSKNDIQADYVSRLDITADDLPGIYHPMIDKLKNEIPSLFADTYPLVINHWDVLENNIHVGAETGHITGIVDRRDARLGPFGMQLWGLENILGTRRPTGMDFHPRHLELRRIFWQTLFGHIGVVSQGTLDAIQTARMVGILLANGDVAYVAPDDRVMSLAVLKSLTLDLDDIGLGDWQKEVA